MRPAAPTASSSSPLRLSRRRALANLGGGAALAALSPLVSCTRGGGPGESGSQQIRVRERESGAPGLELILGRSNEIFPRHSEGDLVQLADGRLLAVWSRFAGASDHARSQIVGRYSEDMGHTWGPVHPVASLSEPEHASNSNLMSASLLRLAGSGEIQLFYMGKEETEPENKAFHRKIRSSIHTRVSPDGVNFSKPVRLSDRDHYYVTNNARVLQLSSGRILVPSAVALDPGKELGWEKQSALAHYSDDGGKTWTRGKSCTLRREDYPGHEYWQITLQEPGLVELTDGRILMVNRTKLNHPYKCFSSDSGVTWSDPEPIREIVAPTSPQTFLRLPSGRLAMIYNNNPKGAEAKWTERRPLAFAVSEDEGTSFQYAKTIEEVEGRCWAYHAARIFGENVFLFYYEWYQGHPTFFFCDVKLSIIPVDWFDS